MNVLLYAIEKCSPLNPELLSFNEFQRENLLRRIQKLKHVDDADKFIIEHDVEKQELDVFVAYQSRMKELNFIEFADMVSLANELFKAHPSILNQYVQKYRYVLCDEFQDTNASQRRILFSLAPEGRISVVGDLNQLIYAFQGADLANFEELEKTFSNIPSAALKTTTLEVNYRSTAAIVRVTNEILQCRMGSSALSSNMRACDANGPGSRVLIVECLGGEEAEWSFILSHIESLLSSGKVTSPSRVAILCRSNSIARRIRDFLRESRSLPFQDDKKGLLKLFLLMLQ